MQAKLATNGTPVTGAEVTVTFFMPAMPAMGMAAMRTVVKLDDKGAAFTRAKASFRRAGLGR